jgi:hypothetical protein
MIFFTRRICIHAHLHLAGPSEHQGLKTLLETEATMTKALFLFQGRSVSKML